MTLQWDFSNTPLARADATIRAPTESELFSLTVAMLLTSGQSYDDLRSCELAFHRDQLSAIAEVFEYRIPELAPERCDCEKLRKRLAELVGIRVTRI